MCPVASHRVVGDALAAATNVHFVIIMLKTFSSAIKSIFLAKKGCNKLFY